MKTINTISLSLLVIFLSSCVTIPLETTFIPADPSGWKVGYSNDVAGKGNIVEYVPSNESIDSWSKLLTVQFIEGEHEHPKSFMNRLKRKMHSRCSNVDWRIIEESNTTILYEWKIDECAGQSTQHEIAKLSKGNDGLHRVAYVEKTKSIDVGIRQLWIRNFRNSYVEKAGKRIVVN